jgi:AcrR family transcriptional regulator
MDSSAATIEGRSRSSERRSQAERRSEAERRLLHAAVHIVAEQGLERFTLAEVGEAAGYSRGLPAHYFGSKEGLVGALAAHIVGGFGRGLVRSEKHGAGLERLLGTASFYFDSAQRDPLTTRALFAVLGEAATNAALRQKIAELNARSVKPLADSIRAGIVAGDIRKTVNAKAQAVLILSGLRGAVAQWLVDPNGIDLKALRGEFIASLKRSLAP